MDQSALSPLSPVIRDPSIASHQEMDQRSVNIPTAEQSPAARHLPLNPPEELRGNKKDAGDAQKKSRQKKFAANTRNAWNIDEDPEFWATYVREAGEFDRELIDGWNKTLDILLIFAALFSAINTAFIIESYSGLQPDANEATLFLLRQILVHRNDDLLLSNAELGISETKYDPSSTSVRINSIFFSSLSCSLVAAFGAVTAKQWLNQYTRVGFMVQLHEQGRRRHWKYKGLETWHFWLMMEILPAVLQLSLVLFLWGTIEFLWPMSWKVATVVLALSAIGTTAYFASLIIAILVPTSPFQTSLSNSLQKLVKDSARPFSPVYGYTRDLSRSLLYKLWAIGGAIWELDASNSIWNVNIAESFHSMTVVQVIRSFDVKDFGRGIGLIMYIGSLGFRGWLYKRFHPDYDYENVELPWIANSDLGTEWEEKDKASAECALWLFERAEHPAVTQRALNAITLLPADRILALVKTREGLVDRLITLYNSHLSKGTGEGGNAISSRPLDAFLAGAALLHILKAGEQYDTAIVDMTSKIQSRYDPPDNVESDLDVALLVVVCGVEIQKGVVESDIYLLQRLFSRVSFSQAVKTAPTMLNQLSPPTAALVTTTTPFSLLLDILIYCTRLDTHWTGSEGRSGTSTLSSCAEHYENILGAIHKALEDRPSLETISHIAIAVATLQWKKRDRQLIPWDHPPTYDSHDIGGVLRASWYKVDKREVSLENVVLALTLVGSKDSPNTLSIYKSLLGIMEDLMVIGMEAWLQDGFTIPAILRVYRQLPRDTTTQHLVLRIMRRINTHYKFETPLHDEEYGEDITSLLSSALYPDTPLTPEIRTAAVDLLDNIRYNGVDNGHFVDAITNPARLYPHREGIARLQFEMWKEGSNDSEKLLPNDYLAEILWTELDDNASLYAVHRETLVLALSNAHHFAPFRGLSYSIQNAFDVIMTGDSSIRWPAYFVTLGIITPDTEEDNVADLSKLPEYSSVVEDPSKRSIWIGEGLLIIWHEVTKREHEESTYKVFFNENVVDSLLQYHRLLLEKEVTSSSKSIFRSYLIKAKEEGVDAKQKREIEEVLAKLEEAQPAVVSLNHL